MTRFLIALFIAFALASTAVAQTAQPDLAPVLADRLDQLSRCSTELGRLVRYEQAVVSAQLLSVVQTRQKFEAANPGQTIGDDFKVKPKDPKQP